MSSTFLRVCFWCKHFNWSSYDEKQMWSCTAFPNGIPQEINTYGGILHEHHYPGDNGIQFELQTDKGQIPASFNELVESAPVENTILLQMMKDMVQEGSDWDYYPGKISEEIGREYGRIVQRRFNMPDELSSDTMSGAEKTTGPGDGTVALNTAYNAAKQFNLDVQSAINKIGAELVAQTNVAVTKIAQERDAAVAVIQAQNTFLTVANSILQFARNGYSSDDPSED